MLERTRETGLKLNPEKSLICVPEVRYFGHRLTPDGKKPSPEVKAIKEMGLPIKEMELRWRPFRG